MEEFCGAFSCSFSLLLLSYCSYHEYCYYGYYYFIIISCWQLKRHVVHYEPFLCLKLYIYINIYYVCIYIHIQCIYIYNDCNVIYECSENVIFVNENGRESLMHLVLV